MMMDKLAAMNVFVKVIALGSYCRRPDARSAERARCVRAYSLNRYLAAKTRVLIDDLVKAFGATPEWDRF